MFSSDIRLSDWIEQIRYRKKRRRRRRTWKYNYCVVCTQWWAELNVLRFQLNCQTKKCCSFELEVHYGYLEFYSHTVTFTCKRYWNNIPGRIKCSTKTIPNNSILNFWIGSAGIFMHFPTICIRCKHDGKIIGTFFAAAPKFKLYRLLPGKAWQKRSTHASSRKNSTIRATRSGLPICHFKQTIFASIMSPCLTSLYFCQVRVSHNIDGI